MDIRQHKRNVKLLFDTYEKTSVPLPSLVRQACEFQFNQQIGKYGFLDLYDLENLRSDLNAVEKRAFKNFTEGNFVDAINLSVLRHYLSEQHLTSHAIDSIDSIDSSDTAPV